MKQHFFALCFLVTYSCLFAQTPTLFPRYGEDIVTVDAENCKLEGSLKIPDKTKKSPVILFISDSGQSADRDGNADEPTIIKAAPLRMLADGLGANGIATLRYDKRGLGKSTTTQKPTDILFDDYLADALLWIEKLKSMNQFSKIIVAGHGEGALVAMVAAQKTGLDGFISLAAYAKRPDSLVIEQVYRKIPEAAQIIGDVYQKWHKGEVMDSIPAGLEAYIGADMRPLMVSWMAHHPLEEIQKLTVPILIVQGKADAQITWANGRKLAKTRPDAKFFLHEEMNHVFKNGDLNLLETKKHYADPNMPLSNGLVSTILDFVKGLK